MTDHDDLNPVFEEFRAAVAKAFIPAGTEEVFHAARQRKTRRAVVTVVMAALVLISATTTGLVLSSANAKDRHIPAATKSADLLPPPIGPTADPSSPASPASPGAQAKRTDLANQVRFLSQQAVQTVRTATITLPAWPTGSELCPAGRFTFVDGQAQTGKTDQLGRPWVYSILPPGTRGISPTDDEMVIPIGCGGTEITLQLLVVKLNLQPMGYIPGIAAFDRFYPYAGDLVVEVSDEPWSPIVEQRRRYHWTGTRFIQSAGPTAFPADRTPDVRDVDLRNSYFELNASLLSFVDSWSGTWSSPMATFELGQISLGLLAEPPEFVGKGDALITVTTREVGNVHPKISVIMVSAARARLVLEVGADGVTAIVSHRIANGLAEITVRTNAGQQVWRFSSDGNALTRVSE